MRLSEDFRVKSVEYSGSGGLTKVTLEGKFEDPEYLKNCDRLITAGRSRWARNFIHGVAMPFDGVEFSGKDEITQIDTPYGCFGFRHGEGHHPLDPFGTVTDPVSSEHLNFEGKHIEFDYLIADVRRLQGEKGAGIDIQEGMEMARLGGFNHEDVVLNSPVVPRKIRENDPLAYFRLEGLKACYKDIDGHADPPEELIPETDFDEVYDTAVSDPEFSKEGIFDPVNKENPENHLQNTFTGDSLDFPTDGKLYKPSMTRGASSEEVESAELEELQEPVDKFNPESFQERCLVKSRDPITYDGFYTLLVKNQTSGGRHLHSVIGDPYFEEPMILEYTSTHHLPQAGRALLIEKE